ncbi:GNAT family N-acetyltransferase [Anaerofustis sp.]|uniref:GNAT family N-acetyltransferase n=1 Tax=Anaerofustis sp. TaxID=1872517 RepID=UPI0025BFC5F4|nr:N-acetyltransferase [Anaerofustis sp.]
MIKVRNEKESDYKTVEEITRKAFYNLYIPGCVEHYLVHIMRSHKDFIPELDFVIEKDGQVIGNVMYTKAKLTNENNEEKEILTFGPVSILPKYQRMGYGKILLEHSFKEAKELGYDTIVIFGNPGNYVSRGFKSCKKYNVCLENGRFPSAMLVKELNKDVLSGQKWIYKDSPVMNIKEEDAEKFDMNFEKIEKEYRTSQEEFYIHSQSFIE